MRNTPTIPIGDFIQRMLRAGGALSAGSDEFGSEVQLSFFQNGSLVRLDIVPAQVDGRLVIRAALHDGPDANEKANAWLSKQRSP